MKTLLFNCKEGFGIDSSLILPEWEVVNAPRPIPGSLLWQGTFHHGIFFAAGLRTEFGSMWDSLDAWPCKLISNQEIIELIKLECDKRNKKIENFSIQGLAQMMKLPFISDFVK